MDRKRTLNNLILIKLGKENDTVRGLFVDTTFDPERHTTVTGTIFGLPSHLYYSGEPNKGMPWQTPLEAKIGDGVIVYYLSIVNALKPKESRCIIEDGERFVLIPYQFIYAIIRDEKIIPANGYVLIEPIEDPAITHDKERMAKLNMELIITEKRNSKEVIYGRVKYAGIANRQYVDEGSSDEGVDIAVDDVVVIRKSNDIPLQYDLHAKIDGGAKYYRVQRRNLLAKI
ncbi:MAG: hypothetical protein JJE45_00130 [Prolixibacteraceae bacterium]|nr:hypothetical protein [Prolixibacteraceae bacterium]